MQGHLNVCTESGNLLEDIYHWKVYFILGDRYKHLNDDSLSFKLFHVPFHKMVT